MKLCFDGDKKKQSGFVFVIRDVFALMHGGVVIAGQVVEGRLCQGDQAVCVPGAGKPFLCLIEAIEQPDPGPRASGKICSSWGCAGRRSLQRKLCAEDSRAG